jgi:hypothetical protein
LDAPASGFVWQDPKGDGIISTLSAQPKSILNFLFYQPNIASLREWHSFLCLPKEKNQKKVQPCR